MGLEEFLEGREVKAVELLKKNNIIITTAESCTGGLIAASIVNVSGASNIFKQGFITYSDETKESLIGVSKDIIDKYKNIKETNEPIGNDSLVWVYWGQGFEKLPFPVENTINSIKKHCPNRKIVLLSDENLSEYVVLKDFIIKKYEDGKISRAEFSDLIRINILKEYGGIWLDSTYYFTDDLDTKISNYSFYSICHGNKRKWVVSKDIWSISFVAVHANSKLMNFVCDVYDRYWKEEDTLI